MKAAFFHDAPLVYDTKGQVYSVGFYYDIWKRYLGVFDSLIVSTRIITDESMIENMKLSSGPNVVFRPITTYKKNSDWLLNKKELENQIKETLKNVDCAIVRLPSVIGNVAYKEAQKMNMPYLIELVGCPWDAFWNHSIKGKLIAPYMFLTTKKHVLSATHVVYVTNNFLQKRYPTNGESISCSNVSLKKIDDKVLVNRLNKVKIINKKNKIIIGTTAAIDVSYKGQQYVIKVLEKLKKAGMDNFEYQLVGGGDKSYLNSIAEKYNVVDQVKFLGTKSHNEVIEWLDTIDIYVQPSMTEGLPRALIEAMSRGLLAIGSHAGGIPELLNKEFVFKKGSIKGLFNLLSKINNDTMERESKRNFMEAKKYEETIIENKRNQFFYKFKEDIK